LVVELGLPGLPDEEIECPADKLLESPVVELLFLEPESLENGLEYDTEEHAKKSKCPTETHTRKRSEVVSTFFIKL